MSSRRRACLWIAVVALALPSFLFFPATGSAADACPELQQLDGVGLVCPRANGLYEVFDDDLESLGFVHGTDPAPAPEGISMSAGGVPTCVDGASGTYYTQVIYARATDDADRFATTVGSVRAMVSNANKLVNDAANATGTTASLRVKCVSGLVEVRNEVLPTRMENASFSTIVDDLRDRGYRDGRVKHWVYYDDTSACSCGGTGHIMYDDRPGVENANNGNAGPMFAITFGYNSAHIMLHELGHNLGAVQLSAPHTSGGWHCIDGVDTMCYNDGGWNARNYTSTACGVETWDCGKDDYFHASPAPGSYLATHWNLGSRVNRYFAFGDPYLASLTCGPRSVELGGAIGCSFLAVDDSASVTYRLDWGDGQIDLLQAAPGVTVNASRTYATVGERNITVGVTDSDGRVGNTRSASASVVLDNIPPTLEVQDPILGAVYSGCETMVPIPITRTFWLDAGCVRATANDTRSGIARIDVYINGALRASDDEAPYEIVVAVPQNLFSASIRVQAVDGAGNTAAVFRNADMFLTS